MSQSRNVTKRGPGRPAFAPQDRLAGEAASFRFPVGTMATLRAMAADDGVPVVALLRRLIDAEKQRREG